MGNEETGAPWPLGKELAEQIRAALAPQFATFREIGIIGEEAWTRLWTPAIKAAWESALDLHALSASLADALAPFERAFNRVFPELAMRGWYLGLSTPSDFLFKVDKMLDAPDEAAIENFVVAEARESLEELLGSVVAAAPQRENLLTAAWESHRHGDFNLSIPLLFAQADGLAFDLFGGRLFVRERRTGPGATKRNTAVGAAISARIDESDSRLLGVILEPIHNGGCIAASETDMEGLRLQNPAFGRLNRHEVMHGRALDYGTEANSLRVMVLLECLVSIWEHITAKR